MHPLPYFLIDLNCQGCLGVGCLSLRTFYLRAGITPDVSATPHLHGGPVHIFSTRRVDFDDSFCLSLLPFHVVCSPSLMPVLAACSFSLSSFPIPFPCPRRCPSSSFRLFVSISCAVYFLCYICMGKSFKGTWLGLMSPLRCLAQTVLGVLPRHCIGAFPRQYFGVVSKYYCGALAKHYIGVLHMHIDIDIDF